MKKFLFYYAILFLLIISNSFGEVIVDNFDSANSNWSYGSTTTFQNGMMRLQTPNVQSNRTISTSTFTGDFELIVQGSTFWSTPTFAPDIALHYLRPYIGFFHAGSTSDVNKQILFGESGQYRGYSSDVHYVIDLNEFLVAQPSTIKAFVTKFVKEGNTISTYYKTGSVFALFHEFTIDNPSADLYFEFVAVDSTSSSYNYTDYDSFEMTTATTAVPEPGNLLLLSLSLLCLFSLRFINT